MNSEKIMIKSPNEFYRKSYDSINWKDNKNIVVNRSLIDTIRNELSLTIDDYSDENIIDFIVYFEIEKNNLYLIDLIIDLWEDWISK